MLSRKQRLSTKEFAVVFEKGKSLRHPLLQCRVFRREDSDGVVRAAFVAPKKLGKAATRNRIRRRLRERYRLLIEQSLSKQSLSMGTQAEYSPPREYPPRKLNGYDLIFLASAAAAEATTEELDAALVQLLQRAARIR